MSQEALKYERQTKPGAMLKLASLQAIGTIVFSLGLYFCFDTREAISALYGGMIATAMSLFMAGRLFAAYRISKMRKVPPGEALIRFYLSVVLKILFTLAMMSIFIVVIEVSVLPFIIAYLIAAIIVNLLFVLLDAQRGTA
jgi:F0F1-type ATP synthase assembly protein I